MRPHSHPHNLKVVGSNPAQSHEPSKPQITRRRKRNAASKQRASRHELQASDEGTIHGRAVSGRPIHSTGAATVQLELLPFCYPTSRHTIEQAGTESWACAPVSPKNID